MPTKPESWTVSPRQLFLSGAIAVAIGVSIGTSAEDAGMKRHAQAGAVALRVEGDMPSLGGAIEWINSEPLTAAGLRGRVVLVDFWTYTCINWLRTLPYVRAWAAKYKDQGLVVIGVHSPEFEFEKDVGNVHHARQALVEGHVMSTAGRNARAQADDPRGQGAIP